MKSRISLGGAERRVAPEGAGSSPASSSHAALRSLDRKIARLDMQSSQLRYQVLGGLAELLRNDRRKLDLERKETRRELKKFSPD